MHSNNMNDTLHAINNFKDLPASLSFFHSNAPKHFFSPEKTLKNPLMQPLQSQPKLPDLQ
ncbi:MAG: hypothetical protein IT258_18825 [Saprospiraceae bacterium]|nr:hypothetical protein [Saprospiraceae bacterium]